MYRYLHIITLLFFFIHEIAMAQEGVRPVAPYIERVTVDTATNNTHIYWVESPTENVEKYIIYYEETTYGGGIPIDSVDAPASHYIHTGSGAGSGKVYYSVAAKDSSGNLSTREDYPKHSTVYISSEYDSCNNRIILQWNKYTGWDDNIAGYRLFRSRNMSEFSSIAGLSYDTVFVDNGIDEQGITENCHYAYFVITLKNDGLQSFSNIIRKYTYMPGPPEDLIMEYASVNEKNVVELSFSFTDTSSINDFALLRSRNRDADFIMVKAITDVSTQPVKIYDSAITGRESFYYKIGALNSCLRIIKESNLAVNILLQGSSSETDVLLQWNPYEEFIHGVKEYIVYRGISSDDLIIHTTVPSSVTVYNDNVSGISGQLSPGEIIYKIGVVENTTGVIAFSNEVVIPVESVLYLPNAFTPDGDGKNDIFRPVLNFLPEEYTMIIYDRSGIKIFQTSDPEEGWDGYVDGVKASEGIYLYYIEYKSFNGIRKTQKPGTLTLFYPR